MIRIAARLWRAKAGSTAVEYALIASLIAVALFGGLAKYYTSMDKTYDRVETAVNSTN